MRKLKAQVFSRKISQTLLMKSSAIVLKTYNKTFVMKSNFCLTQIIEILFSRK